MEDTVSLWCPDYLKLLSEGIWRLFETKYKSDFVLTSYEGEQKVSAHQILLSIFCPQFLNYGGQEFNISHKLTTEELNLLLQFIYKGHVDVKKQLLDKLRFGAEELGMKLLVNLIDSSKGTNDAFQEKEDNIKNVTKIKSQFKKFSLKKSECIDLKITETDETDCKNESAIESNNSSEAVNRDDSKLRSSWSKVYEEKVKEPFKCSQCEYVTNRKDSFRNHLDIHDDHREYVCDVCTRRFRNRRRYSSHVRGHKHPERMLKCDHCEYTTGTRTTLIQHLASRHHVDAQGNSLPADVKCSECDFVCVSKFQLRNHRLYKHSIKPFKCSECDFTAVRKTLVEKHMRMKHKNERPFMCETCGFRSKTVSAFHSHLMVHTNSKPFKCESCAKAYKHNYQLRAHQRSHIGDGKPFLCHICCMAFRRNYEMQVHIRQKHTTTPVDTTLKTTTVIEGTNLQNNSDEIVEMVIECFVDTNCSPINQPSLNN